MLNIIIWLKPKFKQHRTVTIKGEYDKKAYKMRVKVNHIGAFVSETAAIYLPILRKSVLGVNFLF
jgi:hypothetical protein